MQSLDVSGLSMPASPLQPPVLRESNDQLAPSTGHLPLVGDHCVDNQFKVKVQSRLTCVQDQTPSARCLFSARSFWAEHSNVGPKVGAECSE